VFKISLFGLEQGAEAFGATAPKLFIGLQTTVNINVKKSADSTVLSLFLNSH